MNVTRVGCKQVDQHGLFELRTAIRRKRSPQIHLIHIRKIQRTDRIIMEVGGSPLPSEEDKHKLPARTVIYSVSCSAIRQ
ncbi:hypothetical protein YC2023_068494 [Brassica napus]